MSDTPTPDNNILLAYLRRFDEKLERVIEGQIELKERVGLLEQQVAGLHGQYASLSGRLDRIELRLERIEKRLDLIEA